MSTVRSAKAARAALSKVFICLLLSLPALMLPGISWARNMVPSGEISSDFSSIKLEVLFTDVPQTIFTTNQGDLHKHLEIFTKNDSNPLLHLQQATADLNRNNNFYWTLDNIPVLSPRADNANFDMKFSLTIHRNDLKPGAATLASIKDSSPDKVSITLTIKFFEFSGGKFVVGANQPILDVVVEQMHGVPIEAPVINPDGLDPGHRSLSVQWGGGDDKGLVAYNYPAGATRLPDQVLVMVFKNAAGTITLPAKQITSPKTGETADITCTYTPPANSGDSCISCPNTSALDPATNPIYLVPDQPDHEDIERFSLVDNKQGIYSIKNLSFSDSYVVVLQYLNGGKRSSCLIGKPIRTASLTELNGGTEAELKKSKCFIATAAFGTSQHRHIFTLVWFRESFLKAFPLGAWIAEMYTIYSPPIAAVVATSPLLAGVVRALIVLPALYLALVKNLNSFPMVYVNSVGLLVLVGLSGVLLRMRLRRRKRNW